MGNCDVVDPLEVDTGIELRKIQVVKEKLSIPGCDEVFLEINLVR